MIYTLGYTIEAEKDIESLKKSGDQTTILKLRKLLIELMEHPFSGTGRPKPMRNNRSGQWSRRITQKHRLVYSVDDEKITVLVISAAGHYDDK